MQINPLMKFKHTLIITLNSDIQIVMSLLSNHGRLGYIVIYCIKDIYCYKRLDRDTR